MRFVVSIEEGQVRWRIVPLSREGETLLKNEAELTPLIFSGWIKCEAMIINLFSSFPLSKIPSLALSSLWTSPTPSSHQPWSERQTSTCQRVIFPWTPSETEGSTCSIASTLTTTTAESSLSPYLRTSVFGLQCRTLFNLQLYCTSPSGPVFHMGTQYWLQITSTISTGPSTILTLARLSSSHTFPSLCFCNSSEPCRVSAELQA